MLNANAVNVIHRRCAEMEIHARIVMLERLEDVR
jgi:hypothetical protein